MKKKKKKDPTDWFDQKSAKTFLIFSSQGTSIGNKKILWKS